MKKWIFAVCLTALLPLLPACQSHEEEPTLDDPQYLEFAGRLTPETGFYTKAPSDASVEGQPGDIISIELTESGFYVIGRISDLLGNIEYKAGRYSISDGAYVLNGYGRLLFDHQTAGNIDVTVIPNRGATQIVRALLTKAKDTNPVYRTWVIQKTRVTTKGWTTVSAEFEGCDFQEIADFLRSNSHKVPSEVPERKLISLSFTGTESVILVYDDNSADMGSFSLSGDVFSYFWQEDWMKRAMGFTFETDEAIIEYVDGKCVLTINGRIRNSTTSGSVTFLLRPYD